MPDLLAAAQQRARRLYASEGFQGAYLKGARAAFHGLPTSACPYRARGGWLVWRRAWMSGYHSISLKA